MPDKLTAIRGRKAMLHLSEEPVLVTYQPFDSLLDNRFSRANPGWRPYVPTCLQGRG
jgi:hypothetical protein